MTAPLLVVSNSSFTFIDKYFPLKEIELSLKQNGLPLMQVKGYFPLKTIHFPKKQKHFALKEVIYQ